MSGEPDPLFYDADEEKKRVAEFVRGLKSTVTDWQPIETAPKDGTRIIVYRPKFDGKYIPRVGTDYWFEDRCWGKSRPDTPPTMWQPMPEPPEKD